MFRIFKTRAPGAKDGAGRQRGRPPITIGFEQLEGREMLSAGVAMTIIPAETRPLMIMPRPEVGPIDPESRPIVTTPRQAEPKGSERKRDRPPGLWPLGGRFRKDGGPG